ncbi:DUF4245 domain-containing protein [Sinomonas sp. ASV322]|uniref:DUF4245 domain-containing protein n=1 Tax=Sinomonas sp. ASV322 TaxID=3041920 RepID=UPI0027DBE009|nr:DUF4245 domain-containing protein [Sinomonas sp. ASV322]MDQ4503685.1 DUF4245 domain-containing protein [Sinomonas sp. ASV322]
MSSTHEESPSASFKPVLTPAAAKRANASVIGMIMALAVSLLVLLPVVLLSATPQNPVKRPTVDVSAVASDAKGVAGFSPAAPALPADYSANYARWEGGAADGVAHWDVGWVTPKQQFVSIVQTASANPTWIAQQVKQAPKTGTRSVGGVEWTLYDKPGVEKSYVAAIGATTVIVSGSADFAEFDAVASAIAATAH